MYHARLLMNFLDNQILNLPYLLLNSLKKMFVTVQKHLGDVEPHLYHRGLVKILIEKQLKEKRDTWEQFLIRNFFEEPQETPECSKSKRSRRKTTYDKTQSRPTNTVERTSREEILSKRGKEKTPTNTVERTSREERLSKRRKEETEGKKKQNQKRKEALRLCIKPLP